MIVYGGKLLMNEERKWFIIDKECYVVLKDIEYYYIYFVNIKFIVVIDYKLFVGLR